jgi:ornithine decarboxylase
LRLLAALGTGFDCASNGEISQILQLGAGAVDPSRIIFANPCKAVSFIRHAAKASVDMMTFDNADELYKIARTHARAKLIVRILADDSKSLCTLSLKFGALLRNIPALLATARELNLDVIGVSFHVGSGCYDPATYMDAVRRARCVFDMGQEAGYQFSLLDVGGGFEDRSFEHSAAVLKEAIDMYFPEREGIDVIAEPGRFYVSNAFSLAANIIARRAPLHERVSQIEDGSKEPAIMCEFILSLSRYAL